MEEKYIYWLAGLLEGEGSFLPGPPSNPNSPRISVQMTDEDVIDNIAKSFSRKYYTYVPKNPKHKISYTVIIQGRSAIDLMQKIKPLMSRRRQDQINKTVSSWQPDKKINSQKHRRKLTDDVVTKARDRIKCGESLRAIARQLEVHHESLRQRLK